MERHGFRSSTRPREGRAEWERPHRPCRADARLLRARLRYRLSSVRRTYTSATRRRSCTISGARKQRPKPLEKRKYTPKQTSSSSTLVIGKAIRSGGQSQTAEQSSQTSKRSRRSLPDHVLVRSLQSQSQSSCPLPAPCLQHQASETSLMPRCSCAKSARANMGIRPFINPQATGHLLLGPTRVCSRSRPLRRVNRFPCQSAQRNHGRCSEVYGWQRQLQCLLRRRWRPYPWPAHRSCSPRQIHDE